MVSRPGYAESQWGDGEDSGQGPANTYKPLIGLSYIGSGSSAN